MFFSCAIEMHSLTKHAKLHTQTISLLLFNIVNFIPNNYDPKKNGVNVQ